MFRIGQITMIDLIRRMSTLLSGIEDNLICNELIAGIQPYLPLGWSLSIGVNNEVIGKEELGLLDKKRYPTFHPPLPPNPQSDEEEMEEDSDVVNDPDYQEPKKSKVPPPGSMGPTRRSKRLKITH